MKNMSRALLQFLTRALLAALLPHAAAHAAVDISDTPLIVGNAVAPDIMFLLDDSGSMQWEVMPDENLHYSYYLFPPPSSLYGASMYSSQVPTFDDNNIHNFFSRSPTNNGVFYNPQTTYVPWIRSSGASFGNASPAAAPYNPADTTRGTLNLTASKSQSASWITNTTSTNQDSATSACSSSPCSKTFQPITFYIYKGSGSHVDSANYVKYQIRGTQAFKRDPITAAEAEITSFSWPNGSNRTVAEETQNFANWFTYYRSRVLMARAGASIAFGQLGENYRVGFRTINAAGEFLIPTTGNFSSTNRSTWFDKLLLTPIDTNGTPLRTALAWAGKYFETQTGTSNPWLNDGSATTTTTTTTTTSNKKGKGKGKGNSGGTTTTTTTTINDTTMSSCRQAFTILTTDGYWNDSYSLPSDNNADGSQALPYKDSWSNTLADVAMYYYKRDLRTDIDDNVPTSAKDAANWQHMVTFGLSMGVSGTLNPDTDLAALTAGTKSWPNPTLGSPEKLDDLWHATVNGRGAFVNAANPTQFTEGLSALLSNIGERVASGGSVAASSTTLTSNTLLFQTRFIAGDWTGDVWASQVATDGTIASTPTWKASEHIPLPGSRSIYTWSGTAGVTFQWASLTSAQQTTLGSSAVLDYLRGVTTGEARNGGAYRSRTSVLGDIVNSAPVYLGAAIDLRYERFAWTGASTYQTHRSAVASRREMVYLAANDGMLHAFDARTGAERFAYIPNGALAAAKTLSAGDYTHKFINDGTVVIGDVYFGGAWHTVLVGTQGRGGKTIYALDITNPDSFSASKVLWEVTHSDLGLTAGPPVIAHLNDGSWAVVAGNGYNSTNAHAVLLAFSISNGALLQRVDTLAGSSSTPNGLTPAEGVDVDRDGDMDYFYAGDLLGNVWKFDLRSSTASQWQVAFGTTAAPQPFFTPRNASAQVQPITGGVSLGFNPADRKLWVFFGTGRYLATSDLPIVETQSWYGLIDNSTQIASRSDLAQRVILEEGSTDEGDRYRIISKPGDVTGGASMTGKKGWYLDLTSTEFGAEGERIVARPVLGTTTLFVSTLIPNNNPCEPGGNGWVLGVNPFTGGRQDSDIFDYNRDGVVNASDQVGMTGADGSTRRVVGSGYSTDSLPGSPLQIGKEQVVGGSDGTVETRQISDGVRSGRASWKEILGD